MKTKTTTVFKFDELRHVLKSSHPPPTLMILNRSKIAILARQLAVVFLNVKMTCSIYLSVILADLWKVWVFFLFTKLNFFSSPFRSLRMSTYCVSCVPGTSTWTKRGRSFASRWLGGSSTRWTTCWRPGAHRRSCRTTTQGAGTTTTEVGKQRTLTCTCHIF